jgi:anti-anti-sigma factor
MQEAVYRDPRQPKPSAANVLVDGQDHLRRPFRFADQVDEALDKAFNAGSTATLDLQDVTFVDSMVLGVIAKARLRALSSGGAHRLAVVVEPNSDTERVIHLGLDHYLDLFGDLDTALTAMNPAPPLAAG